MPLRLDPEVIADLAAHRSELLAARASANDALQTLQRIAGHPNRALAEEAYGALDGVLDASFDVLAAAGRADRLTAHAEASRRRSSRPAELARRYVPDGSGRWWIWPAIGVSFAAVASVLSGLLLVAGVLVLLRAAGSLLFAGTPVDRRTPLDAIGRRLALTRQPVLAVWACLASHVLDAAVLGALSIHLLRTGAAQWSALPTVCTTAMLAGTLARVAPSQVAVIVGRSVWERVVRVAGTGTLLIVASFADGAGNVPLAAFAGAPAGAFGLWELGRMFLTRPGMELEWLRVMVRRTDGRAACLVTERPRPAAAAPRLRRVV
ncbi:MAG: hypothetical protein R2755_08140 [Acidimicrobiales bacterium]